MNDLANLKIYLSGNEKRAKVMITTEEGRLTFVVDNRKEMETFAEHFVRAAKSMKPTESGDGFGDEDGDKDAPGCGCPDQETHDKLQSILDKKNPSREEQEFGLRAMLDMLKESLGEMGNDMAKKKGKT
jgi:hypothetical protein